MTNKELQDHLKLYPDDAPVVLFADRIFYNYTSVEVVEAITVKSKTSYLGTEGFNPSAEGQTAIYLHPDY